MSGSDDQGFRGWFRHVDGETYSALLKGMSLEEAVATSRRECDTHGVALMRIEAWTREQTVRGGVSVVWLGADGDRWQRVDDTETRG